jgi:ABC-type branched-subunit amino acid transport system substrate-binding protein
MAANYTAEALFSRAERRLIYYAPASTASTIVDLSQPAGGNKLVSIANFRRFAAGILRAVGTGTTTEFALIAADDAAGATNPTVIIGPAPASNKPAAANDMRWLECDVEQVREVSATAKYVGVRMTQGTSGDTWAVYFERNRPMFPKTGLTADYVA